MDKEDFNFYFLLFLLSGLPLLILAEVFNWPDWIFSLGLGMFIGAMTIGTFEHLKDNSSTFRDLIGLKKKNK